jgi:flagellar biosynthesis protein FlhF
MKIIRHTARDMRAAMRGVREQLGEDAVILSSRKTSEGIEITAAIDFDASTLEAGGFANSPVEPPPILETAVVAAPPTRAAGAAAARSAAATNPTVLALTGGRGAKGTSPAAGKLALVAPSAGQQAAAQRTYEVAGHPAAVQQRHYEVAGLPEDAQQRPYEVAGLPEDADRVAYEVAGMPQAAQARSYGVAGHPANAGIGQQLLSQPAYADFAPLGYRTPDYDAGLISEAAREAVAEHMAAPRAPVLAPAQPVAGAADTTTSTSAPRATRTQRAATTTPRAHTASAPSEASRDSALTPSKASNDSALAPSKPSRDAALAHTAAQTHASAAARASASAHPTASSSGSTSRQRALEFSQALATARAHSAHSDEIDEQVEAHRDDPVEEIREATLTPLASNEVKAAFAQSKTSAEPAPDSAEAMGNELKTLRRMLETQLAHLAWNDLTRRAPVHTEMLRELTEIGITQDLAEHLVRQLPQDTELTFARRFTIAGLSQYLKVTGDRWLDDGGRVAFAGATGVGKTTTLAKIAVRWVLRHGPRDIALVAGDSVRIGAQDQLQSLAQLLGVPVYTPETFESLPTLLSQLNERLILIDTPGSSVRDPQLAGRLAVLANSASKLETALVLAASTQAGAIEEAVKHFAPANPSCCVLTKLDEAASLGGILSVLIRGRLPVSYMSEGQRVPEDLRPARALELVSTAVRLAKASGAAADEDLLRRRFGKTAHGIS